RRSGARRADARFILATCVKSLLHATLTDDRHHTRSCQLSEEQALGAATPACGHEALRPRTGARIPAAARIAHVRADEGVPDAPGPRSHESCARCVTPAADVRIARAAVQAPALGRLESLEDVTTADRAAP